MGLVVIALVTVVVLLSRRLWAEVTSGLGEVKTPPRTTSMAGPSEIERWRRNAQEVRPPRPGTATDCEVLVVGAGPSGLMTAALPARQGVHVRILLRKAMGVPVSLGDPVWTSRYRVNLRQVASCRVGRGFLVGDAAHVHSPAGGQGLNTGLHDAANLAWKLAAVLHTGADESLLDTYSRKRHPAGAQLLKFTDRLYRVAADLRGWRAWLRDTAGPFLLGPSPTRRRSTSSAPTVTSRGARTNRTTTRAADSSAGCTAASRSARPTARPRPRSGGRADPGRTALPTGRARASGRWPPGANRPCRRASTCARG